ncbi:hypothetical protein FGB62_130g158 [Gracilaria domingensis]|nr:hypothetical protein FGB62_130g158 [Gracilaria domingensis]
MAVVATSTPCFSSSLYIRCVLLFAVFLFGYNFGQSRTSLSPYFTAVRLQAARQVTPATPVYLVAPAAPVAADAQDAPDAPVSPPIIQPPSSTLSSGPLEIYLEPSAVKIEGIGAVLSGLKPILMLANVTGARITMNDNFTGHGYNMSRYLDIQQPFPDSMRVPCNVTFNVRKFLVDIVEECDSYDFTAWLRRLRIFHGCNSLSVSKYIAHPRMCLKHTQDLVTSFTKFETRPQIEKNDVCVLRRGGDIEDIIRSGEGNKHAIDEELTVPILRQVKERGGKVVLVTETNYEDELRQLYEPHVFSNFEDLQTVVSRLESCRCTFVSSSSAFATAMLQITKPTYMVYTSSRPGFSFSDRWYHLDEFGRFAIDVTSDRQSIVESCAPLT